METQIAPIITAVTALAPLLKGLFNRRSRVKYVPDPALTKQLNEVKATIVTLSQEAAQHQAELEAAHKQRTQLEAEMREQKERQEQAFAVYESRIAETRRQLEAQVAELDKRKIKSIDELKQKERDRFLEILRLCEELAPAPLEGINVGFFGVSGDGKSALLNATAGKKVCEEGLGETTSVVEPVRVAGSPYTYWNVPGQTDQISYFDATYIGMLKAMQFIGIVCNRTTHTMSKTIELLDHLGLKYYIIVNKYDLAVQNSNGDAAVARFRSQIQSEVTKECRRCAGLFFVSAREPGQYDWNAFMTALTSQ